MPKEVCLNELWTAQINVMKCIQASREAIATSDYSTAR